MTPGHLPISTSLTDVTRRASLADCETGLTAGARVMTAAGPVLVEDLRAGDRIVTPRGLRQLRGVKSIKRTPGTMTTIRASALGHDRPAVDIYLGRDQGVLICHWRALALFGSVRATIPAGRLVDGWFVTPTAAANACFDLVFDGPEIVFVEGLEIAVSARGVGQGGDAAPLPPPAARVAQRGPAMDDVPQDQPVAGDLADR